jgi:hypothetical protein
MSRAVVHESERRSDMSTSKSIATALGLLAATSAVATYGADSGGGISRAEASAGASPAGQRLPQGSEPVHLNPADFTTRINNPYWPMRPGSRWVYRETDPDGTRQKVVVTVTRRTKRIANGITARVVHDVVTEKGRPVEVTDDWYAQDKVGNVWYLGEATTEYVNGKPTTTAGSFEAGVDGAQTGIIMPAKPEVGLSYRQEYYAGQAEDKAAVVSLEEQVEVPFGHFRSGKVVMTRDLNPLKPRIQEFKFFARGVGPVLAVGISGGSDREELLRFRQAK